MIWSHTGETRRSGSARSNSCPLMTQRLGFLPRTSLATYAANHDKQIRKLTEEFSWLSNLAEISVHGQPIVICHYAMRVWNRSHHGAWHLYGHSHGNLPDTPTSLSMDVGVDTHNFRPWHFDEIDLLMTEKAKRLRELRGTDTLNIQ